MTLLIVILLAIYVLAVAAGRFGSAPYLAEIGSVAGFLLLVLTVVREWNLMEYLRGH